MEHRLDQERPGDGPGLWMLLCYRVPREPSAPRIAIWRKLKRLGVAQLGDGLVALPADARTREQLEWVAEDVTEAGGSAGAWLARPATLAQERELATAMAAARAAELRRITRRDYFPPAAREQAHAAVEALAGPHDGRKDAVLAGRDAAAAGGAGEHT